MKIQISPTRKVEDALVVWPESKPEVDIVQDLRWLKMRSNSVKAIYAFDALGLSEPKDVLAILQNLFNILEPNGEIYIIEQDFDYISRAYLGGDLSIDEFNRDFRRSTYLNNNEISRLLEKVGFPTNIQKVWYKGLKFPKEHYQIIISGKKPELK